MMFTHIIQQNKLNVKKTYELRTNELILNSENRLIALQLKKEKDTLNIS